jgi:hypothetical protein
MRIKLSVHPVLFAIIVALIIFLIGFSSFYTYWNTASPEKTCAACHEINLSVNTHKQSAHRDYNCKECHGTALSNGFHSLKEKGLMVVNHIKNENIEDISLNEEQILEVMNHCRRCHTSEYAKWSSGGHSARYRHILLDSTHNHTEQINPDCLRCHGMFSDIPVSDLVEPINITGPWKFKNPEISDNPTIPCMACHQIHIEGFPLPAPDYSNPKKAFYNRKLPYSKVSFYSRVEKTGIPAENLPKLILWEGERSVIVSDDLLMRNCIQCHAPNAYHQAGTSDDRTPRGVHEGISCIVCHEPHSNDARQSCLKCHPVISNCGQDVEKMNTTFYRLDSPNDIHWITCTSCHEKRNPERRH